MTSDLSADIALELGWISWTIEPFDERSLADEPSAARWRGCKNTNHSPGVIALLRRARRALPGDPEFGDPLRPPALAVRAPRPGPPTGCSDREAASREVSLGALQVWQALTERVSGKPAYREVTLVFTDLVGFSVVVAERG